jgi:hypothetical protein
VVLPPTTGGDVKQNFGMEQVGPNLQIWQHQELQREYGQNSSVNALAASGLIPPVTANTEEWTAPDIVINTLTTS